MRVLVAYGSKMGGTAGLAEMVGDALRCHGIEAVVQPAGEVDSVAGFDAVVIGGALYAGRWHRDARRFAARHAEALRDLDVWVFSSGPLDGSATEKDIPPTRGTRKVMDQIDARGHVTFGGRLDPEHAVGWIARSMAKKLSGDWRDADHVDTWVAAIVEEVKRPEPAKDR